MLSENRPSKTTENHHKMNQNRWWYFTQWNFIGVQWLWDRCPHFLLMCPLLQHACASFVKTLTQLLSFGFGSWGYIQILFWFIFKKQRKFLLFMSDLWRPAPSKDKLTMNLYQNHFCDQLKKFYSEPKSHVLFWDRRLKVIFQCIYSWNRFKVIFLNFSH